MILNNGKWSTCGYAFDGFNDNHSIPFDTVPDKNDKWYQK